MGGQHAAAQRHQEVQVRHSFQREQGRHGQEGSEGPERPRRAEGTNGPQEDLGYLQEGRRPEGGGAHAEAEVASRGTVERRIEGAVRVHPGQPKARKMMARPAIASASLI